MRIGNLGALLVLIAATSAEVLTQTPAQPTPGPTFDVVSIKRNTTGALGSNVNQQRPDGGFAMTNVWAATLVARAYPPVVPADIVGLPGWATSERYDVSTASTLTTATPDQRTAMLRAMLADRFSLVAHFEKREQPVYDLVLARSDGRLGPGITRLDVNCDAKLAADRAAAEAALVAGTPPAPRQMPDLNAPPPPCTLRSVGDRQGVDRLEGETSMANLASFLRIATGRQVVDKTGLTGSFRVAATYDRQASMRGPDAAPSSQQQITGTAPTVFAAVQEQLGLKLESSRAERDTLVIDRLERPTEN